MKLFPHHVILHVKRFLVISFSVSQQDTRYSAHLAGQLVMENITEAKLVKIELSFSRLIQKLRGCWWHQWEKMLVKGTLNYQFKYIKSIGMFFFLRGGE